MKSHTIGARFYQADLHAHTPASKDYQDPAASPADIINAAIAKNIAILAVTDHNTAGWIDQMRTASRGTSVCIVPGVEITTPEGHIIALFDATQSAANITDLLVTVGIPRDQHGREQAISTMHAEEVVRVVVQAGGLAIAAHANESSGVLKSKGQYKMKVVAMPELAALELTKQDEIERFCTGKVSPDYPKKACTYGSDAHQLSEIGRRTTYLKMDAPSFRGIRQALLDCEVRVRFPWNYKECGHPHVLSLTTDQGFFGGQPFAFHESLNCLVGGKGTGKSTVVELLRYCFDDVSEIEIIREDHDGKVRSLVGDGGTVVVEYLDGDGEIKTIRREVQPWPTPREVRDSAGSAGGVETPPVFFSQGELVLIAASQIAQLDLIDRRLDLVSADRQEAGTIQSLRENARTLTGCETKCHSLQAEIEDPERGKAATEAHYQRLEQKLKDPMLKEFPQWEAEQQYLAGLDEGLVELGEEYERSMDELDLDPIDVAAPAESPNAKLLKSVDGVHAGAQAAIRTSGQHFGKAIADLRTQLAKVAAELKPLFAAAKAKHAQTAKELGTADIRQANAQYRNLGKRLEELRKFERELAKHKGAVQELRVKRNVLRAQLNDIRHMRWQLRAAKGTELQDGLSGTVQIVVVESGDRKAYAEGVRVLSRTARLREADIHLVVGSLLPSELVQHVISRQTGELARVTGITTDVAQRLVEGFLSKEPEEVYELECVEMPDRPEITYAVEPGRYKRLQELSTGGKGTVIISLAMIEGLGPLIVDQPEEPLDTQSIYGQVVRTLRRSKETRQFILTTHNPNVAVGADAELSHILNATADKGTIESSGAVDHAATNRLLLEHLEGGEEALGLRIRKYSL